MSDAGPSDGKMPPAPSGPAGAPPLTPPPTRPLSDSVLGGFAWGFGQCEGFDEDWPEPRAERRVSEISTFDNVSLSPDGAVIRMDAELELRVVPTIPVRRSVSDGLGFEDADEDSDDAGVDEDSDATGVPPAIPDRLGFADVDEDGLPAMGASRVGNSMYQRLDSVEPGHVYQRLESVEQGHAAYPSPATGGFARQLSIDSHGYLKPDLGAGSATGRSRPTVTIRRNAASTPSDQARERDAAQGTPLGGSREPVYSPCLSRMTMTMRLTMKDPGLDGGAAPASPTAYEAQKARERDIVNGYREPEPLLRFLSSDSAYALPQDSDDDDDSCTERTADATHLQGSEYLQVIGEVDHLRPGQRVRLNGYSCLGTIVATQPHDQHVIELDQAIAPPRPTGAPPLPCAAVGHGVVAPGSAIAPVAGCTAEPGRILVNGDHVGRRIVLQGYDASVKGALRFIGTCRLRDVPARCGVELDAPLGGAGDAVATGQGCFPALRGRGLVVPAETVRLLPDDAVVAAAAVLQLPPAAFR